MAEALYSWIESLVCYFVLLSAVMNFLPDNSYKKYIQYYMGLLLILVILAPVFRITGMREAVDSYVEEFSESIENREAWEEKAENWEENWQAGFSEEQGVIQGQEVLP